VQAHHRQRQHAGRLAVDEEAGRRLLLSRGVSVGLARFAATHASWDGPGVGVENLLVSQPDCPPPAGGRKQPDAEALGMRQ
jgi:hypothetical protein